MEIPAFAGMTFPFVIPAKAGIFSSLVGTKQSGGLICTWYDSQARNDVKQVSSLRACSRGFVIRVSPLTPIIDSSLAGKRQSRGKKLFLNYPILLLSASLLLF